MTNLSKKSSRVALSLALALGFVLSAGALSAHADSPAFQLDCDMIVTDDLQGHQQLTESVPIEIDGSANTRLEIDSVFKGAPIKLKAHASVRKNIHPFPAGYAIAAGSTLEMPGKGGEIESPLSYVDAGSSPQGDFAVNGMAFRNKEDARTTGLIYVQCKVSSQR